MANANLSDLENAVMDALWEDPVHTTVLCSVPKLMRQMERIHKLLEWAKTLNADQGKKYYIKWLEFFEKDHIRRLEDISKQENVDKIKLPKLPE